MNSSVMEMKYLQYRLLRNSSCKENLVIYPKYEIHDLGNALFFVVRNLWSSVLADFFFVCVSSGFFSVCLVVFFFLLLFANVLLTFLVRGKLCCNRERQTESD